MTNKTSLSSKRPSRVQIVDDHPLVRRGLAELISDEPDLEVCAEACNAAEALQKMKETSPDVLVIDISLDGTSGLELIKQIRARSPHARMLVSSMHDESLFAERSLRAGAMGYINKGEATEKVVEAIRHVLDGNVYLSTEMSSRLLHGVVGRKESASQSTIERLSDRELEVFGHIGRGLTTRDIADKLHLSVKTVETHREHIKSKLDLKSTPDLIRHAVQWTLENG